MPAEMNSVVGSRCGTSGALGMTRCSRLRKCSRKRVRISFPVITRGVHCRGEAGLARRGLGNAFPAIGALGPPVEATHCREAVVIPRAGSLKPVLLHLAHDPVPDLLVDVVRRRVRSVGV